ncbi:MAG: TonB-dependent receptor [Acidobacteria bacterium]|nr:TonB-dependent receptor [Acidobacteriota bacterium]
MPRANLVGIFSGLLYLAFTVALPQSSKGTLVGIVLDPSGARIPGGSIKVANVATNAVRETISTGQGTFRLDAVDPGTYRVEVSLTGFKTLTVENIVIAAGQTTDRTFSLEIGSPSEVVSVTAETTVILQTQEAARTNTLDLPQISDLPVAALNPVNLVFTLPGVVSPGVLAGGFVQGPEFAINGTRPRANSQLLDGTENNDISIHGQFYQTSLREGYQEVSVLGGDYSAEYGRAGGAVINVITRSGTNQFHGSLYDVIVTSALFSLSPGQKNNEGLKSVPVETENTFGFSLGGPIKRDTLFFFGTFQPDLFRAGGATASAVVPTEEGFNLLRSLFPPGRNANLDRYLNVVGNLRGTTNVISIPLGGGRPPIPFGTATRTGTQPVNDYQWMTRLDWVPTTQDNVAFRYLFDQQIFKNQFPSAFEGFEIDVPSRIQNFYLNYTRSFSHELTNEFRFSYGRFRVLFGPRKREALAGPRFQFAGIPVNSVGLSAVFPQGRTFNNFQYQDTVSRILGNHTIRAGIDLVRQLTQEFVPINTRGTLTFSAGGGFPTFGNFVDGFSGTQGTFASKVFGSPLISPNRFQQAYFMNDSWRVLPNLTLNIGLRYENYGTPENILQFPAFAGLDAPLDKRVRQEPDNNNFAPRFGFAYTPHFASRIFGENKTVFRGGYAINYDVFFDNILGNAAASSPNAFGVDTLGRDIGGRGFPNAGVNSLPVTGSPNPRAAIQNIAPNLVNPLTHTWNFGVQRVLPSNTIVDVAYVGTRGERLFLNEEINVAIDGRRIDPNRGSVFIRTNGGDSNYHSLQTLVERGLKDGLFVRFAYTYSKVIDDVNSEVFLTTGGSTRPSDSFNRRADRSVASFDVPHRAVWTFLWDLPGPKSGFWGQLAGWTLSGIYRLQSAAVETPYVGGVDLNDDLSAFNDRPAINSPNAPPRSVAILGSLFGLRSPTGYIDANGDPINPSNTRYIVDPALRKNIAGRNTLRAERTNRVDLTLNKAFKMPFEGHKLEIRIEFFNLLNHPNFTWADPGNGADQGNGDVLNPFFNDVRANDGSRRTGRLQVRYEF